MEEMRKQFEAEFRRVYANDPHVDMLLEMYNHGTEQDPDIDYYSLVARDAWEWWCRSRAALVVTLPKTVLTQEYRDDIPEYRMMAFDVKEAMRKAGITINDPAN